MKNNDLTIRILNNTNFSNAYKEFLLEKGMSRGKYIAILSIATLFINSSNENVRKLGYRIIVIYCNRVKDYKPLYDISVNSGIIPVSQFIEDKLASEKEKNFFTEINAAYSKNFVINNIFCSLQQKELVDFYNYNRNDSLSVVAPTSYGKTDLILHTVKNNEDKNICVITPTKSLLAQTKARIVQANKPKREKIITHPEMYSGNEDRLVAVMTQERVLRLLQKAEKVFFDYVIIDEAHSLLHDDDRNMLLASVILVLEKRNPDTVFKFLTPFLCDANNIKIRYAGYSLKTYKVDEYIKTEKLYVAELRDKHVKEFYLYDQFINKFYKIDELTTTSEWDFVNGHSGLKNIIYFNKPKDIESFVQIMISERQEILDEKILEACKNIAEYVHPDYRLIECVKRGVIYHHGAVPEPVRMYIERLYAELNDIKYVVTSSTLLEGVNLPADKMFIMDNKKGQSNLSPSDFKNLIGRVCRFSQIFDRDTGSLTKLEPEIYLVVGRYFSANANAKKFIQNSMYVEKTINDELKNVLLEKTTINQENQDKFENAQEFIENYEGGIIQDYSLRKVKTETGKICFMNNITEFDIFSHEEDIEKVSKRIKENGRLIDNTNVLFEALNRMFFSKITDDNNIKRFDNEETRRFYKMFLDWRISNTSLNQMISSFMRYWKGLIKDRDKEKLIFVGRWGDTTRDGVMPLWTDISKKTEDQLINLAIVRIKEEQDFLDNVLLKYIEVLNDLELLEESLYLRIKYGTDDKKIITCTKNGISLSLAKKIVENYMDYVEIDVLNDTVSFREGMVEAMRQAGENEIMICELLFFL